MPLVLLTARALPLLPRLPACLLLRPSVRIMIQSLPPGVKIAKDAKECMCEMAGEMVAIVTMEAVDLVKFRGAVGLDECLTAFKRLGLHGLSPAFSVWQQKTCLGQARGGGAPAGGPSVAATVD